MAKTALIIVDIQNDYFSGGKFTLTGMDEAADNAAILIDNARKNGDLVIYVRHEFPTGDAPFFAPGSEGAKIHKKVKNIDGEHVIVKNHINAFRNTDLGEILDNNGIDEVVICGAMSHMCIDAVSRAANDFGYDVIVVHDACATRDLEFNGKTIAAKDVHNAYMSALQFGYAKLVTTAEHTAALQLTKSK
ncbi:MAG: cysteine hydrolase family protein [Candidatus Melainabacteria bacterium]|nr:cysteine hydrolase family protein [Candidatus Melainabacteria bacterium]